MRKAGVIEGYYQDGDYFWRNQPERDLDGMALTANVSQLLALVMVPIGIRGYLIADILASTPTTGGGAILTSGQLPDPSMGDTHHSAPIWGKMYIRIPVIR